MKVYVLHHVDMDRARIVSVYAELEDAKKFLSGRKWRWDFISADGRYRRTGWEVYQIIEQELL